MLNVQEISFLPIIERELRRLSRRPFTYRARSAAGFGAALISLGVLAVSIITGSDPVTVGRAIFLPLAVLSFGISLMTGPILTADCLCEEKRAGTLGLLFLTNLNGFHVVAGKLLAMALPAAHCLLAVFPVLAISFWLGGVTGGEFLRTAVVLSGTLLFSLSAGLLASAICEDGRKALAGAALSLLLVVCVLPALSAIRLAGGFPLRSWGMLCSPGYAAWMVPEAFYDRAPGYFWAWLPVVMVLSLGMLLLAGWRLSQSWQNELAPLTSRRRSTGMHNARFAQEDRESRNELLEENPVIWLAQHSNRSNQVLWFIVAGVMALVLGGFYGVRKPSLYAPMVFLVIYGLHTVLKIWIGWEAGRRFAEDRSNGSFELLLCTPLPGEQILKGWLIHFRRRFLLPVLCLVAIDLTLLLKGISPSGWWGGEGVWGITFLASVGLFLTDTYSLCWVGLWQGLSARNPTQATLKTFLYVLLLPMLACASVFIIIALFVPVSGGAPMGAITGTWFAVGYISDAALCGRAMTNLTDDFRNTNSEGNERNRLAPPLRDTR